LQLVGAPAPIAQPAISESAIIDKVMQELEGSTNKAAVKIATAAAMLSLDPSTIRRYGKRGRLLLIAGGLVNVDSIRAFARGETNEYQSETRVRRKGIEITASRPQQKPEQKPERRQLVARYPKPPKG
jgi:hypothetical protein